jgi:hypothetical protein
VRGSLRDRQEGPTAQQGDSGPVQASLDASGVASDAFWRLRSIEMSSRRRDASESILLDVESRSHFWLVLAGCHETDRTFYQLLIKGLFSPSPMPMSTRRRVPMEVIRLLLPYRWRSDQQGQEEPNLARLPVLEQSGRCSDRGCWRCTKPAPSTVWLIGRGNREQGPVARSPPIP